jgi:ABC-type uncharacterized transport system fused permease/ATPase subunit
MLNKPTDLEDRLAVERYTLEKTRTMRETLAVAGGGALDRMPITMQDLKFTVGRTFDFKGKLKINQGEMACFVGKHGEGKSTLLKVIAGSIFPVIEAGELFIPSHLRVLHVSLEPLFFQKTIWENITYGCEIEQDRSKERVVKILHRLGMRNVCAKLDSDDTQHWADSLTTFEKHMLNFVRGIVANPYVICIHKPTMACSDSSGNQVMEMLKEFVTKRGIEQDVKHAVSSRRPRTVLYTSCRAHSCEYADVIYLVTPGRIQIVSLNDVKNEREVFS